VRFLVGFETEFCLLKPATDGGLIVPVNDAPWAATRGTLAGTPEAACMDALADALDASGIVLEMYHAEAAPGQVRASSARPCASLTTAQYEIVTGPLPPLEAADALVVTREAILNTASAHGLRATFAPRPFADDCAGSPPPPPNPSRADRCMYAQVGAGAMRTSPCILSRTGPRTLPRKPRQRQPRTC
jgi:glutamine synthetase